MNFTVSKVSKNLSTLSARLAIRAKRAALEAERSVLETQQALEKEKLQIEQTARELKLRTELAKIEAEEKIYSQAMGGDLVDLQSDYEKKFQSQVNLPTMAATKHSFVNPEVKRGQDPRDAQGTNSVKDEDQASSYVAREFLRSMSNIQQQQQRQIKVMVDMQGQQHDQLHEVFTYHREMAASMSLPDVEVPIFATAYVNRVVEATPIKSEDGIALQTFSVLLISCRNALKEIGYLNKINNPDCLIKIIEKLPFSLRQKWKERPDDITNNKVREINFDDVVKFVEERVRVMNHPIFGRLSSSKV